MLRRLLWVSCLWLALPPAAQAGIDKDLELRVKLLGSRVVRPQEPIQLRIELTNRSRNRSYTVVKPGDGSGVGWREPHVYFTAEARAKDGTWKALPKRSLARCGMFDPDWNKDVVKLGPGRALLLKDWLPAPERAVEYQQPGAIRVYVHYVYSRGRAAKGKRTGAVSPGRMGATPGFHLVSKPVQLKVIRPLDLRLKVKRRRLAAGWNHQLSRILSVTLENRSGQKQVLTRPTTTGEAQLHLELKDKPGRSPRIDQPTTRSGALPLRPGQTATMLGRGVKGLDGYWSYPEAGKVLLRAVYTLTRKPRGEIASDWVEIEFFKRRPR
jgi:hypothetical protein